MRSVPLPPPVVAPARVGIAALSGPVDPARLARGCAELRRLGFEPVLSANISATEGLFAGSDSTRVAAFHQLAADPSIPAIFFARGGHGVLRALPLLDWSLLAAVPRAYVGYSDATPLLLGIVQRIGLAAFHGPMVATTLADGLAPDEERSLLAALSGHPVDVPLAGADRDASGVLAGGCLSLLAATVGTPFAPDFDGALLFWEDVAEPLFRLDRMLTHLRLSGNLKSIRAMLAGRVEISDRRESESPALAALLAEHAGGAAIAWGVPSGHTRPNWTLPFGVEARVDAARRVLAFGETRSADRV